MRELKFKAWDRKQKKMFPIQRMEWNKISNELVHLSGVDIHDKDSDHEGDVYYGGSAKKLTGTPAQLRYVPLQYTGWKDDTDTEVYESDLIMDMITAKIYEILWDETGSGFGFADGEQFVDLYDFEDICSNGYRIVGNIYENPDLLPKAPESNE